FAVPALFLVWVNLHGGWIVGGGVLAIWTVVSLLKDRSSAVLLVSVGVLSLAATLINPYGWHMWEFLGTTVRMTRPITEWQPIFTTPPMAWIPWLAVSAGVALSLFAPRRPPLA